jgi:hypothetical protein
MSHDALLRRLQANARPAPRNRRRGPQRSDDTRAARRLRRPLIRSGGAIGNFDALAGCTTGVDSDPQ